MCGICGIWGKSDGAAIERMVAAMHHRGPDDGGVYADDRVALGMRRLAVIDLTAAAHQPMSSADGGVWGVYNGEVYNFQDERRSLAAKGHTFRSHSDTEVVLRLYEQYGEDFVTRLRGMFAVAIYDRRRGAGRERLLLARDPLGIKPLLYTSVNGRLYFASEIKSLLASGEVARDLDPEALRLLLTFGSVHQPRTMVRNVHMLPPAHRLIAEGNTERLERYWSPALDRVPSLRRRGYGDLVEETACRLEESVRLEMVSDVPIGAFLSGGVDSSLLVGLMTRSAGRRVKTFSIGFGEEGTLLDETDEAARTAAFLGSEHRRVAVTGAMVREQLERITLGLDQPSVDGVNSFFVSQAARQAVTVAISGTGGDELFAGYPWFARLARYAQTQAESPRRSWGTRTLAQLTEQPLLDALLHTACGAPLERWRSRAGFRGHYSSQYAIFGAAGAAATLAPHLRRPAKAGCAASRDLRWCDELCDGTSVERTTILCLRGYTNNQLLRDIDATSMAHSLEVRVPFLDVPLLDFSLSLPPEAKLLTCQPETTSSGLATYRETGSKRILVDAGRRLGILREDIDLQPKRGFAMPFTDWLHGPLHEVLEDTWSERSIRKRGWLDPHAVARLRQSFRAGQVDWPRPWLLMILELWARSVLEGNGDGA